MISGRVLLRAHGALLAILGSTLLVRTLLGRLRGTGPFAFLAQSPVTAVGFHEAYGLVALAGLALVFGAGARRRRRLHLLAAALHAFLFTINLTHFHLYAPLGMVAEGVVSTAMHVALATVELAYATGFVAPASRRGADHEHRSLPRHAP